MINWQINKINNWAKLALLVLVLFSFALKAQEDDSSADSSSDDNLLEEISSDTNTAETVETIETSTDDNLDSKSQSQDDQMTATTASSPTPSTNDSSSSAKEQNSSAKKSNVDFSIDNIPTDAQVKKQTRKEQIINKRRNAYNKAKNQTGKDKPLTKIYRPQKTLQDRDDKTGLVIRFNPDHDASRWSAAYHMNAKAQNLSDLTTLEFIYGMKWGLGWMEFILAKTSGRFDALTTANSNMSFASQDDLHATDEDAFTFGVGYSLRSQWIMDFFGNDRWSESTSAAATYNTFSENYQNKSYKGFGVQATFGINYRLSKSIQIGPKMSWHLASVKHNEDTNLVSDARSLLLSWFSLAFDFTYYLGS